jgi:hypothetical protein
MWHPTSWIAVGDEASCQGKLCNNVGSMFVHEYYIREILTSQRTWVTGHPIIIEQQPPKNSPIVDPHGIWLSTLPPQSRIRTFIDPGPAPHTSSTAPSQSAGPDYLVGDCRRVPKGSNTATASPLSRAEGQSSSKETRTLPLRSLPSSEVAAHSCVNAP